jgi:hypothetical protein
VDELPPDAGAFLTSAKDVHDPHDPQARARVERRLWASLALGGTSANVHSAASPGAGAPTFSAWLASNKVMLASIALMVAAGSAWLSLQQQTPNVAASVAPAPSALAAPLVEALPAASQVSPIPVQASAQAQGSNSDRAEQPTQNSEIEPNRGKTQPTARFLARRTVAIATPPPAFSLAEEAALLARASTQLTQRNAQAAAKLLDEHARRYPDSQLHEEREGFLVMADCLRGAPEAPDAARVFVSKNPGSVLIPRVSRLCAL